MKNHSSLVVWALAAAVLGGSVACGEVSSNKADASVGMDTAPPGDFTIGVNPGTLSIGITGEGTVAIDLVRGEGLTDAVALSVTGAPTGVTTAFDAASLPLGTNTANLTVTADNAADAGTATLTVTATAGAITHTATLELTLTTITVTGSVRGGASGLTVRIVGKTATTSDGNGNFMFTDVKVPYDIYVISQTGPSNAAYPAINYYKGLTRPDPVLSRQFTTCVGICPITVFLNNRTGRIVGSRSGAGTNAGPTYLKFTSTDGVEINADGSWDFNVGWFQAGGIGGTTISGRLQGLQAVRGTLNAPTGWLFAQSPSDVTVTHGAPPPQTSANLTLAALGTTAALTGSITIPNGFDPPQVTLSQQLAGHVFEVWTATTTDAASVIPVLLNQKASFHARSVDGNLTSEGVFPNLTASTDVSMSLPAPAGVTGPANNAMNITATTPFSFTTTSPNQVYEVRINSTAASYLVYTATGSLTIPNVEELPLASSTAFTWDVRGYGPHPSVNAAADAEALKGVAKFESAGAMHTLTTTPSRNFTTQ